MLVNIDYTFTCLFFRIFVIRLVVQILPDSENFGQRSTTVRLIVDPPRRFCGYEMMESFGLSGFDDF